MSSIPGQIFESFEQIGESVVSETAKVPKEIAGKALESLGSAKNKQGATTQAAASPAPEKSRTPDAWDTFDRGGTDDTKRAIAREALAALIRRSQPQELSVWERIQKEMAEDKQVEKEKKSHISSQVLPASSHKRPRGDLYGVKAKRAAAEMSRNVRQD